MILKRPGEVERMAEAAVINREALEAVEAALLWERVSFREVLLA